MLGCAALTPTYAGYFKERFDAWRIRLGYKKSVVAVAHKIIKIVHVMLSRKVPYQDKSADYEALLVRRNRSRWIKALKKFGHLPGTA
jgi:transposase